jgi:hypothetical protein
MLAAQLRGRETSSESFNIPTICSSVYRLLRIGSPPGRGLMGPIYRRTLASGGLNQRMQLTSCIFRADLISAALDKLTPELFDFGSSSFAKGIVNVATLLDLSAIN